MVGGAFRWFTATCKSDMQHLSIAGTQQKKEHIMRYGLQAPQADATSPERGTSQATASDPGSSSQPQHAQRAVNREEEEERRGLVCMVCKEGYASRPTELLAAYCYCMKLRPGEGFGAVPEVWMGPGPPRPDSLQVMSIAPHHSA